MRFALSVASVLLSVSIAAANAQTPFVAEIEAESSSAFDPAAVLFTDSRPVPEQPLKGSSRFMALAEWPGCGRPSSDARAWRSQCAILATERAGFIADMVTTGMGLTARRDFAERDPINTLFGNRNVAGVLGSMTAWELGYSYAAVNVPGWLRKTPLRGTARVSALILDSLLAGQRFRVSMCNLRLLRAPRIASTASCQQ